MLLIFDFLSGGSLRLPRLYMERTRKLERILPLQVSELPPPITGILAW